MVSPYFSWSTIEKHFWKIVATPIILATITFLVYKPSLHYGFQFDDIANIQRIFGIRFLTFSKAFMSSSRWFPFWINAINYSWGQFDPFYYRLFNVFFHISAGIVLFYFLYAVLSRLSKRTFFSTYAYSISTLTTLLFLLHPVQTQTVTYVIQGRLEGLASLFLLCSCALFYYASLTQNQYKQYTALAGTFIATFIACGTKEISIIAPALLLLVDWFFVARGNYKEIISRWILYALYTGMVFTLFIYFLKPEFFIKLIGLKLEASNNIGNVLTEMRHEKITPLHFMISQFQVIIHYIWIFIWPYRISVEYDWKMVPSFFHFDCLFPLFLLLCIATFLFKWFKQDKTHPIIFGALWFFAAILPRSSIIPSSELLVDYKTYLASIGLLFILATALVYLWDAILQSKNSLLNYDKKTIYLSWALTCFMVSIVGFSSYRRNLVWSSGINFWTNIIENAPNKARAYNNLAVALVGEKKVDEAIVLYKKAIRMDSSYPDPWNNLAVCYAMHGKNMLAIETLKKALRIYKHSPEIYSNLGSFYLKEKDFDNAEKVLKMALSLRPHYGKALFNYGKLYMERNDPDNALLCFKKACTEADLDNEAGFIAYGQAAFHFKRFEEAAFAYGKLARLKPHNFEYAFKYAYTLCFNKQYTEAARILSPFTHQQKDNGQMWNILGECYYHTRDFMHSHDAFTQAQRCGVHSPQQELRMITCLQMSGYDERAYEMLQAFLKCDTHSPALKVQAKEMLAMCPATYDKGEKTHKAS